MHTRNILYEQSTDSIYLADFGLARNVAVTDRCSGTSGVVKNLVISYWQRAKLYCRFPGPRGGSCPLARPCGGHVGRRHHFRVSNGGACTLLEELCSHSPRPVSRRRACGGSQYCNGEGATVRVQSVAPIITHNLQSQCAWCCCRCCMRFVTNRPV